jgi:hypothetical protein
MVNVF